MKKSGGNKNQGPKHNRFKHGMTGTPTYKSWACMKSRCLNKSNLDYPNWGGRGIKVCEDWMDFKNFLRDMGVKPEGMTIERLDVNADYSKSNCIWASRTEQSRNRNYNRINMDQANQIRQERKSGETYLALATRYGLSQSQVFRICKMKSWV